MKVKYHGKPRVMMYQGFSGKVKEGDVLEMTKKNYVEFANLNLEIIEPDKSKSRRKK